MTTLADLLYLAAGSMNVWRDGVVAALAGVVIGCLYLIATVAGES